MKIFLKSSIILLVLLFASPLFASNDLKENKPLVGRYEVISPFTLEICSGAIRGACVNRETFNYKVGSIITSDRSFYDNTTKSWNIGWVSNISTSEENSTPLSNVKKISDTISQEPKVGKYEFVEPFRIEGCVEYVGIGIRGGDCEKTSITNFDIGDVVYSHLAIYNSEKSSWEIGILIYNQNRGIPTTKLKKVSDTTLITKKNGLLEEKDLKILLAFQDGSNLPSDIEKEKISRWQAIKIAKKEFKMILPIAKRKVTVWEIHPLFSQLPIVVVNRLNGDIIYTDDGIK